MLHDPQAIQKANLFRVIYIGICLMTLYTAYNTHQALAVQVYAQLGFGNLGNICLFLVFGFFALCSIVAPFYQRKLSAKTGLMLGAIPTLLFVFAGLLTSGCIQYDSYDGICSVSFIYIVNIICAILVGVGTGFLWLCQAMYVNACADEQTKGLYNGLFLSIFQLSQILGGGLTTFVLGNTDQFTFYLILSVFGVISLVMITLIKAPVSTDAAGSQHEIAKSEKEETVNEALEQFKEILYEPKYMFFFWGVFLSGAAVGCYVSFLGTSVQVTVNSDDFNEVNERIGFALLALAIGEVVAGLTTGPLADRYDRLQLFNVTMIINETALMFTFLGCLFNSFGCALIGSFLWGYGETGIQTMINTLIGSMFGGKPELFSTSRFLQAAGFVYTTIVGIFLAESMPLFFMTVIGGSLGIFHFLYFKYMPVTGSKYQEKLLDDDRVRVMKNF
jgi:MFS family permease